MAGTSRSSSVRRSAAPPACERSPQTSESWPSELLQSPNKARIVLESRRSSCRQERFGRRTEYPDDAAEHQQESEARQKGAGAGLRRAPRSKPSRPCCRSGRRRPCSAPKAWTVREAAMVSEAKAEVAAAYPARRGRGGERSDRGRPARNTISGMAPRTRAESFALVKDHHADRAKTEDHVAQRLRGGRPKADLI